MDAKHSPLPWRVFDEDFPHFPGIDALDEFSVVVWGDEHEELGVRGHTAEEARANAEFIVRCVNSHDALLKATRDALDLLEDMLGTDCEPDCECLLHPLRAAIAKAEGGHQ